MDETHHTDTLPFIPAAPDGDVPAPFDEDAAAITSAIRALVRGPRSPGPVDRSAEAQAVRAVAKRVEALTAADPAALRQRLALHAELANALVVIYTQRAADTASPGAQATYAGIAMRAMAVGARLLALVGASAPAGGDGARSDHRPMPVWQHTRPAFRRCAAHDGAAVIARRLRALPSSGSRRSGGRCAP